MLNLRRFPGRQWPLVLFGFISVFWGNFGQSFFVGVYGESFKQSLNLSAGEYGGVYSLATLLAGFIFLFAGVWIDKIPLRLFALASAIGLCAACICLALVSSYWVLFLGLFLVRLFGQSLLPHTGMVTMARSFERDRGKALGMAASAVPCGEIVLPLLAIFLLTQIGHAYSWFAYAFLVFCIYIPLASYLVRKEFIVHIEEQPDEADALREIRGRFSLLKELQFWCILPAVLFGPFVVTGIFIHQDFVLGEKVWSGQLWASAFVLYGVVHWLSSFLVGELIDRYSAKKVLPWYNVPILLALLFLLLADGYLSIILFLGFLGVAIGFGGPLGSALWAELYGKKHLGGIRSMVAAFVVVATAVSPILFGLAIDNHYSILTIVSTVSVLGLIVIGLSKLAFHQG